MNKSKYPLGSILRPKETLCFYDSHRDARYIVLNDDLSRDGKIRIFVQKSAQPDTKPYVLDWYEDMMEIAPMKFPGTISFPVVVDMGALQRSINQTVRDSLGSVEDQLESLLADATADGNWGAVEFLGKKLREFKDTVDKYEV